MKTPQVPALDGMTPLGIASCNCYVRAMPEPVRFVTRRGAHALDCPAYRESGDPVDRRTDAYFRRRYTRQGRD